MYPYQKWVHATQFLTGAISPSPPTPHLFHPIKLVDSQGLTGRYVALSHC